MFGFIIIYHYVGEGTDGFIYDYCVRETDAAAAIKRLQRVDPFARVLSVQIVPAAELTKRGSVIDRAHNEAREALLSITDKQ